MQWSQQLPTMRELLVVIIVVIIIIIIIMSRNRWQEIKSNLHLANNANLSTNNDKMFKVPPMIDHLRSKFKEIPKIQNLCIDEQIVPFRGASSLKQYVPNKPNKWGYKMFVLADEEGMTYDCMPYPGKIEPVDDPIMFLI